MCVRGGHFVRLHALDMCLPSTLHFHSLFHLESPVSNPNARRFFRYRQNEKNPLLRIVRYLAMSGECEEPPGYLRL